MKFIIRFAVGNRFNTGSRYNLKEFCIAIVDRYSLTDKEVLAVVKLEVGGIFRNEDLEIRRVG